MLRDRNDYPQVITPTGVAIWPALNEPDYKFKKEFGEYHARLRFRPEDLTDLVAQAEKIRDEAFDAKAEDLKRQKKGAILKELTKADVVKPELDGETGDETGFVILRASMNAGGKRRSDGKPFEKRPDIFDARGKTLKNPPRVGGGSELKLAVRIMDYETDGGKTIGARFELEAAQIIKLVSGGQRAASDYGFGEEDGDAIEDGEPDSKGFGDETGGNGDNGDF